MNPLCRIHCAKDSPEAILSTHSPSDQGWSRRRGTRPLCSPLRLPRPGTPRHAPVPARPALPIVIYRWNCYDQHARVSSEGEAPTTPTLGPALTQRGPSPLATKHPGLFYGLPSPSPLWQWLRCADELGALNPVMIQTSLMEARPYLE